MEIGPHDVIEVYKQKDILGQEQDQKHQWTARRDAQDHAHHLENVQKSRVEQKDFQNQGQNHQIMIT